MRKALGQRLVREKKTVAAMISMYCRDHHTEGSGGRGRRELCPSCVALREYAHKRLDVCPFGQDKPTCAKCPVHCYRKAERERITEVMRYAGPRMLRAHPVLAVRHLADSASSARPRRSPTRR